MSSVTVQQHVATFTTVDGAVVMADALLEVSCVNVEEALAYKVVCIPIGRDDEPTYQVDSQTFEALVKAKNNIDLYLLNKVADSLG